MQRDLADSIILMVPLDDIRILLACGAKVNEPVTQGLRALHYAVWQKHTEAVRLLLVRGADINATDDCGYSALHLAAEHGYFELTQLLLDAGAKLDYRQPTDELFPRTTLCDEPLRLALKNRHYVGIFTISKIREFILNSLCIFHCHRMLRNSYWNTAPIQINDISWAPKLIWLTIRKLLTYC